MHAVILDKPSPAEASSLRMKVHTDRGHNGRHDEDVVLNASRSEAGSEVLTDGASERHTIFSDPHAHFDRITLNPAHATTKQEHPQASADGQLDPLKDFATPDSLAALGVQDEDLSGQIAQISISHDGDYATAVCLAALEPMDDDVGGEAAARSHL